MDNKKLMSRTGGGRGCLAAKEVRSAVLRRSLIALLALMLWGGCHLTFRAGSVSLSPSPAYADDIQYTYDELGRLIQASNLTSGQVVVYTYDAAGNIGSQNVVPLGTLSIAYFSPDHGPAGTPVTISGTGFSPTASGNAVLFNGTTASIANASTTQLVVSVPAGASTGS
jgi:hypothetical protein